MLKRRFLGILIVLQTLLAFTGCTPDVSDQATAFPEKIPPTATVTLSPKATATVTISPKATATVTISPKYTITPTTPTVSPTSTKRTSTPTLIDEADVPEILEVNFWKILTQELSYGLNIQRAWWNEDESGFYAAFRDDEKVYWMFYDLTKKTISSLSPPFPNLDVSVWDRYHLPVPGYFAESSGYWYADTLEGVLRGHISDDGSRVLYTSVEKTGKWDYHSQVWMLFTQTGEKRLILESDGGTLGKVLWLGTDKFIFGFGPNINDDIYYANLRNDPVATRVSELTNATNFTVMDFSVSPDQSMLAVSDYYMESISLIDLDTWNTEVISTPSGTILDWSPDSSALYFSSLPQDRVWWDVPGVARMTIKDKKVDLFWDIRGIYERTGIMISGDFDISSDGTQCLVWNGDFYIVTIDE